LPDVDVSFGLDEVENPRSRFAQEIRKVYDAVRETARKPGGPSVLVIALDDEDDAAMVALPLAATAAATQRLLLIDADPERRTLAAIDADQGEAGLVDVAAGRRDLAEVVVHDRDTRINVVPFIAVSSSRTRSISDEDVKQAFDRTKRFDLVIVAATDDSDGPGTRFFAGLVDHIVVVARAGEDAERAVAEFAAQLGQDAGKIRGTVLTGADGT
jgi:Mrp family chromosome partitioning ATPase